LNFFIYKGCLIDDCYNFYFAHRTVRKQSVRQLLLKIFLFPFAVGLSFIFLSGCEKKYDIVINSVGSAPVISDAKFSPTVIYTDTIYIGPVQTPLDIMNIHAKVSLRVIHPDGKEMIESVNFTLGDFQSSFTLCDGTLHDDGVFPDSISDDNTYSGYVDFQIQRVFVGDLFIKLWSKSRTGSESNNFFLPVHISRFNHAPVISNLVAPDTLYIGNPLSLTLQVNDSDGLSDVYEVGYLSLKPDSSYANNGDMIQMYDDGNAQPPSGDLVAGDGIYTYTTTVLPNTTVGTYVFTFSAFDRLHATSNTIIHRVTILPLNVIE
jgi:hypothetical protein